MKILVIAPHVDAEVLGVGGAIARIVDDGHDVQKSALAGHGDQTHPTQDPNFWEAERLECKAALKLLGCNPSNFGDLLAARLDAIPSDQINRIINAIGSEAFADTLIATADHLAVLPDMGPAVARLAAEQFDRDLLAGQWVEWVTEARPC